MHVCRELSKVYQKIFLMNLLQGAVKTQKTTKTLNAYNSKTLEYKLMRFGMLRDNNVLYFLIPLSLQ
jgi:hypothetical protein